MSTEQIKPQHLAAYTCPKCGSEDVDTDDSKGFDGVEKLYMSCNTCQFADWVQYEAIEREPYMLEIEGVEYDLPREAAKDADVSGLVDGYEDIKDAFGDQIVPQGTEIAKVLRDKHDWTGDGADELVRVAFKYGSFFLRNALALSIVLNIEDGEAGY